MSGVVSFEPCSSEDTEVTLKIRSIFGPPSLSQRLEEYLELLRCFCLFTSTHRLVHISELVTPASPIAFVFHTMLVRKS